MTGLLKMLRGGTRGQTKGAHVGNLKHSKFQPPSGVVSKASTTATGETRAGENEESRRWTPPWVACSPNIQSMLLAMELRVLGPWDIAPSHGKPQKHKKAGASVTTLLLLLLWWPKINWVFF